MTEQNRVVPAAGLTPRQTKKLLDGVDAAESAAMSAEMTIDSVQRDLEELRREFNDFDDRFDAFVRWVYEAYDWWRGAGGGPPVPASRGLSEEQIRRMVARMRGRLDRAPNQEEVAAELHTSESTLRRAMRDLGMEGWPPPPED